jgi:DNA-binding NtrC family response regulator
MTLKEIKQRFEIIGNSPLINIALETAIKVAPTEITVLISGESGVGKEAFSKIIHQISHRKHGPFIAVNCGAIPGGTIDSELFGHEKGAFTGAHDMRKGYFETVNGGTIFLDEVGELPLETQSRLLRVLESGEFIKVGSSKVQKTDVRVVTATNRDLLEHTMREKFREDLYYRLSTVPIRVPPLRERKEDIYLLFRKFAYDFADKYKTTPVQLTADAQEILINYRWPGNIRQLKNVTEQISVLVAEKTVDAAMLLNYLPKDSSSLPMVVNNKGAENFSERDIFYKVLFDLKKDVTDMKKLVLDLIQHSGSGQEFIQNNEELIDNLFEKNSFSNTGRNRLIIQPPEHHGETLELEEERRVDESLSLEDKEVEMIKKALIKNKRKRKKAAQELGISERTLYRKIKQYDIEA